MIRKALIYSGLLIGLLLETVAFATAKTYLQLGVATFSYIVLAFIFLVLYPRVHKKKPLTRSITMVNNNDEEEENVDDTDKRAFLHLIWTAGIAFFIYSIVSRRAELSFFGKAAGSGMVALEDSAGNKINPAQEHATDGYLISDIDDTDTYFVYYGYTKANGNWYVTKHDIENGTFRYAKGDKEFSANWNNRTKLRYDYFYNILP